MGYLQEIVVKAKYMTRPNASICGVKLLVADRINFDDSILVVTDKGNSFLLHSGPGDGLVCTDASNMSDKWFVEYEICVKNRLSISELMNSTNCFTSNYKFAGCVMRGLYNGDAGAIERALSE